MLTVLMSSLLVPVLFPREDTAADPVGLMYIFHSPCALQTENPSQQVFKEVVRLLISWATLLT